MENKKNRLTNAMFAKEINIVLNTFDKQVPLSLKNKLIRHEQIMKGYYSFPEFGKLCKEIDINVQTTLDQAFAVLFGNNLENNSEVVVVNLQTLIDYEKIMELKMDKRYTITIVQSVDKTKPFYASVNIMETNGLNVKTFLIGHEVVVKHPFGKIFLLFNT